MPNAQLDRFVHELAIYPSASSRNLVTGEHHTVSGDNNFVAGQENAVFGSNSEAHGLTGTVNGSRSVLFSLDEDSHTTNTDNTFEVWADRVSFNGSDISEPTFDGQYSGAEHDNGNSGTSKTLDWDNGNTQILTLTGNCTLTLTNPRVAGRYLLILIQDGTGSRTVTWPAAVKWRGATAPTLTTTAGAIDLVTLAYSSASSGIYLSAANLNIG